MTPPQESRAREVDDERASLAIVPRTVSSHFDALGKRPRITPAERQSFPVTPPDPQTVGLYLAACADGAGRITAMSVASLERRLSGIAWHYRQLGEPLDAQDRHIATVLAGIRRAHGRPPCKRRRSSPTICSPC